jgi:SAM-dependent methyltransferase
MKCLAMDVPSIIVPYGACTGYIVAAVELLVLALLVVGFHQGREITFWPPRVGPRARTSKDGDTSDQPEVSTPSCKRVARRGRISDHVSMTFEAGQARQFYGLIAANYDERNSANLLATHMETIERIEKSIYGKANARVLDLGGGTGQNIATHFFNDDHIHWDYVDACPEMATQLRQKLTGRRLHKKLTVREADINNLRELGLHPKAYDVILLSLVLSSMPSLPDFGIIAEFLAPGGRLIISDINPDYTYSHPYYQVTASDDKLVAMRMNPVRLIDLVKQTNSAGLRLTELTPIGSADPDPSYSFIASFNAATAREAVHELEKMSSTSGLVL